MKYQPKPRKDVKYKCFEAYIKLLEEKDYTNISISDVSKVAKVSRTSFYRCFTTFDALVDYTATTIYEKLVSEILPQFLFEKEKMWRNAISNIFTKLKDGTAIISKVRPANFTYVVELVHKKINASLLDKLSTKEKYDPVCNLAMVFAVAVSWSKNGFKEDAEELTNYLVRRIME